MRTSEVAGRAGFIRVRVLHVADCPGTATLLERLSAILATRTDIRVERQLIADERDALAFGMTGSPTMLVDGADPFATGAAPSLACRLYRDERGAVSGSPSVAQLLAVLHAGWRFAGTSARSRGLPEELRRTHRSILGEFLATGRAPDLEWLWHNGISEEDLRRLATEDLVQRDDAGAVVVAYPFSGRSTPHRVELAGGPAVSAMCALDALGIPQLAGRDGVVESVDPVTGEPIRVEVAGGIWRWQPAATVVLVARSDAGGPVFCCSCPHINFHTGAGSARSYVDGHPGLSGEVLDQRAAVDLADLCFGALLEA
jgi:alkylmercury lyase-like protein